MKKVNEKFGIRELEKVYEQGEIIPKSRNVDRKGEEKKSGSAERRDSEVKGENERCGGSW